MYIMYKSDLVCFFGQLAITKRVNGKWWVRCVCAIKRISGGLCDAIVAQASSANAKHKSSLATLLLCAVRCCHFTLSYHVVTHTHTHTVNTTWRTTYFSLLFEICTYTHACAARRAFHIKRVKITNSFRIRFLFLCVNNMAMLSKSRLLHSAGSSVHQ